MENSQSIPNPSPSNKRRLLSGTRGLLVAICLVALGLGWFTHEYRRAERRTTLLRELARYQTYPRLNEPTILGGIVKKFSPQREAALRDKIGAGWFDQPSVFVCFKLGDKQVPQVVPRLRELETVQEVHYDGAALTDSGIAELHKGLTGVNVAPNASPELHRYFLAAMGGTHTHYGLLIFVLAVVIGGITLLVYTVRRSVLAQFRPVKVS